MKDVRMIVAMVICMVLSGTMQVAAGPYDPAKTQKQTQTVHPMYNGATAPNANFHSTSTMAGSGSAYMSTHALNENGTVNESAYTGNVITGPRRNPGILGGEGENQGTGGTDLDDGTEVDSPIGDAVLPLLLMAAAFGGVVYLRRRKAA